ncbi:hypothetical protein KU735_23690, partial [Salmonella enterica subsp. enterica serovar Give]|nr:hypothetical protein [Salmonella enterica subsp. enterica serovar Give]
HRFVNCLQKTDGFDTWDIDSLEKDIRLGLKKVCNEGILIDSITRPLDAPRSTATQWRKVIIRSFLESLRTV